MRQYFRTLCITLKILITIRKKIVFIGGTTDTNLGDNAQRFLIREWCKKNYPHHQYLEITEEDTLCPIVSAHSFAITSVVSSCLFWSLRLTQRAGDLIVFSSGYGMVEHAWDWLTVCRLSAYCNRTPILIMPQTINFMNPWLENRIADIYNRHPRIMLLCRDFISLKRAKDKFLRCNPIAWPDIVTSLIGTEKYAKKRSGVLFCVRNDTESFYHREEIRALEQRFDCRVDESDTSPKIKLTRFDDRRRTLVSEYIDYVAGFKAVITDRYHGTIFSMIANTPVVVISSTDHKLSSGVKWFPEEVFGKNIQFADTLDKAYEIACEYLKRTEFPALPTYFKDNYWDKLKGIVDETLLAR